MAEVMKKKPPPQPPMATYSKHLLASLQRAGESATQLSHGMVTCEHLMLALLDDHDASFLIKAYGVDLAKAKSSLLGFLKDQHGARKGTDAPKPTPQLYGILEQAAASVARTGLPEVESNVVLALLLEDENSVSAKVMQPYGLDFAGVIQFLKLRSDTAPKPTAKPELNQGRSRQVKSAAQAAGRQAPARQARPANQGKDARQRTEKPPAPPEKIAKPSLAKPSLAKPSLKDRLKGKRSGETPAAKGPENRGDDGGGQKPPAQSRQTRLQSVPPPRSTPPHRQPPEDNTFRGRPPAPDSMPPQPSHLYEAQHLTIPEDAPAHQPPQTPPYHGRGGNTGPTQPDDSEILSPTGSVLEMGRLVENIPRRLRAHDCAPVEVRIIRPEEDGATGSALSSQLIAEAITVQLRAPGKGLLIEGTTADTQWIKAGDAFIGDSEIASWHWILRARRPGKQRVKLVMTARTVNRDGRVLESHLPDTVLVINVQRNWSRLLARLGLWLSVILTSGAIAWGAPQLLADERIQNLLRTLGLL